MIYLLQEVRQIERVEVQDTLTLRYNERWKLFGHEGHKLRICVNASADQFVCRPSISLIAVLAICGAHRVPVLPYNVVERTMVTGSAVKGDNTECVGESPSMANIFRFIASPRSNAAVQVARALEVRSIEEDSMYFMIQGELILATLTWVFVRFRI